MATNSGRGNPIAAEEGPQKETTPPPPVSTDLKTHVARSAEPQQQAGEGGEHVAGHDAGTTLPATRVETGGEGA
ncbi:hypothetical protein VTK73DRAFT_3988 [Phialemonium thermophilum]|uniref:Uncharacterized protein n=1 Tax=Phialemonium thermophilum TaxID=223376 RepID=A0ABR3VD15_9PEZI